MIGKLLGNRYQIMEKIGSGGMAEVYKAVSYTHLFNASRRAIATLESGYILEDEELGGAKKVLGAAAMTYVASAAMALAQLLRLILIRGDRD